MNIMKHAGSVRKYLLCILNFVNTISEYADVTKATMHIDRKPGEQLEVDWAGKRLLSLIGILVKSLMHMCLLQYYHVVNMYTSKHFYPKIKKAGLLHMSMLTIFLAALLESSFQTN